MSENATVKDLCVNFAHRSFFVGGKGLLCDYNVIVRSEENEKYKRGKMVLYNLLCAYSGGGNIHYYPSPQLGNIPLQADGRACGYLRRGKDIRLYILRYL